MSENMVTDHERRVRPAEAAQMLGCSRLLVYRMLRDEQIPSIKVGNRRLIRVSDINAYLHRAETKEVVNA